MFYKKNNQKNVIIEHQTFREKCLLKQFEKIFNKSKYIDILENLNNHNNARVR